MVWGEWESGMMAKCSIEVPYRAGAERHRKTKEGNQVWLHATVSLMENLKGGRLRM